MDFIEVYDRALNPETCDYFRSRLDRAITEGDAVFGEEESRTGTADCTKNDGEYDETEQLGALNRNDAWMLINGADADDLLGRCVPAIQECLDRYLIKYASLQKYELTLSTLRIQKSFLHGGLHFWHFENWPKYYGGKYGDKTVRKIARQIAFVIYLNDIPENEGETEFLYQGRRINPVEGRVMLCPAGFTHIHRANPVYTKEKYIVAGNIEFSLPEVSHVNSA